MFQNMLDIVDKLRNDRLCLPKGHLKSFTDKVYFYLGEKEKEVNYLLKVAKRLDHSLKEVKVAKVMNKNSLLKKVKDQNYSLVVLSNEGKEIRGHL